MARNCKAIFKLGSDSRQEGGREISNVGNKELYIILRAGDEIQLYVLPATNLLLLRYSAEPRDLMLLWARLKATPTRDTGI